MMTRVESILAGIAAGCLIILAVHNIVMAYNFNRLDPAAREGVRAVMEEVL